MEDVITILSVCSTFFYFLIAAQGAFYLFGFVKALYAISPAGFIELRKAVDAVVRVRFKVLYLSTLFLMLNWFLLLDKTNGLFGYVLILAAFVLLLADLILVLKVIEPVNKTINGPLECRENQYEELRSAWLKGITIRAWLSNVGFSLIMLHDIIIGLEK